MKTILIIEADVCILENLTEYFEMENYFILACNNGKEGIEQARKFIPDLIISNILMTGNNGYEVLNSILNTIITSKIPFIFSTTMAEKEDKARAMECGADDYIVKPYDTEILIKMARGYIESGCRKDRHTFSQNYRSLQA